MILFDIRKYFEISMIEISNVDCIIYTFVDGCGQYT